MTTLERNVKQAQIRLGLNRGFGALGWCLLGCCGLWCPALIAARLSGWSWPLGTAAASLISLAVLLSALWAVYRRPSPIAAAAILDRHAELKERTSSALYLSGSTDPFARATLEDARAVSRRVRVAEHIRFSWPSSLSYALAAALLAIIVTALPIRPLLAGEHRQVALLEPDLIRKEVSQVQRKLQALQEQVSRQDTLNQLDTPLKTIDDLPIEKLTTPVSVRREAIKNIDTLADTLRRQREERSDSLHELKRMFRGLNVPQDTRTPSDELSKALAKGDFQSAQEAVRQMREQLAKLATKDDPEQLEHMRRQIASLAQQLQKAAEQQDRKEQLQQQLEQAGVDPETAKRALENLTKADLQKIKEQMKQQGANDKQIQEMAKKMQNQQQAGKQCSGLAQAMQQAAQSMGSKSSLSDAASQMQAAAEQIGSMEQLQQQLDELDSMMADAQQALNELDQEQQGACSKCSGNGCSSCNNTGRNPGGGMGPRPDQGRGGRGPEEQTAVRFQKQRTPVITTPGAIIGKMFVNGEQVRGDVSSDTAELYSAAEREATDALNDNKIPNQYRSAVKRFFAQMRQDFEASGGSDTGDGK